MNKESQAIADYIEGSGFYLDKIAQLKDKQRNIKEFTNEFSYYIMEIVNTEPKFIHMNRKAIDLPALVLKFF